MLFSETTANTLTATLALLALYPEEQEWVYQSILDTIGEREPVYAKPASAFHFSYLA